MNNLKFIFLLSLFAVQVQAQTINISGPAGSGQFGKTVTVLTNGNFVVTDPSYDEGGIANVGAVYLYNGVNHTLISTLKGSAANDSVGSNGITPLSDGDYLVHSPSWNNGAATDAGALTWCNATTGLSGVVSSSNSLVGNNTNDNVGGPYASANLIIALNNGNYLVRSPNWNNKAGAVTWANGITGITGIISSSNSLVGSTANDQVGIAMTVEKGITVLNNGNYVIVSPYWDNGSTTDAGAATWGNGITGISGVISSSNSLVGSSINDILGFYGVTALPNSNYIVTCPWWDNGSATNAGAATWCSGITGITGVISSSNSLIGTKTDDFVGQGSNSITNQGELTILSNGNYVVTSGSWGNGLAANAGAVTWGNGTTGISGEVSSSNSLVGTKLDDRVGIEIAVLNNGNYVVMSSLWDNGSIPNVGAVTWANGTTGISGAVSSSNSLVGSKATDMVGGSDYYSAKGGVVTLSNGNYIVSSPTWDNGSILNVGAVTWANGTTGITGVVDSTNSLVGNYHTGGGGVIQLSNGNYVVTSPDWNNGALSNAGAVTWANGTTGITGKISSSNSLTGVHALDRVGSGGSVSLSNGNYVVSSPYCDNGSINSAGAVTWANGTTGITGNINYGNSLTGTNAGDFVGGFGIVALNNGNYLVRSGSWGNYAGAVTWGNGTTGVWGSISSSNSLVGDYNIHDSVGKGPIIVLSNNNYLVTTPHWGNGVGAVSWGNGSTGTSGVVSNSNSLVGSKANDMAGIVTAEAGNNYIVNSPNWDNGAVPDAGAVTLGSSANGVTGNITSCNSVIGAKTYSYNNIYNYLIAGRPSENTVSIFNAVNLTLAVTLDSISQNIYSLSPTPLIASTGCRIIATLTPNGNNPVSGTVKGKVWIEPEVPVYVDEPFVARHYEISLNTYTYNANGNVTLYFTQQEFNDFNAHAGSTLDLPTDESDAIGIANLRIGKYPGTSNNGSGLPGTYPSIPVIINPNDADIVWNNSLSRWEVSFDGTGFGGFVVQTKLTGLPLQLLNFSAVPAQNDVLVSWKTTNEINTKNFEVERSTDGRNFITVGTVSAINNAGDHSYNYADVGAALLNTSKLYYRLKIIDNGGRYNNSQIVLLHLSKSNSITVYPNPLSNMTTLSFSNNTLLNTQAVLIDMEGKRIKQFIISNYQEQIDMSHLPGGMYILKLGDGTAIKLIKN